MERLKQITKFHCNNSYFFHLANREYLLQSDTILLTQVATKELDLYKKSYRVDRANIFYDIKKYYVYILFVYMYIHLFRD